MADRLAAPRHAGRWLSMIALRPVRTIPVNGKAIVASQAGGALPCLYYTAGLSVSAASPEGP